MLFSNALLLALPLVAARPHLPGAAADLRRREHHARAAVTNRPLVERAGGAISNETRDEISVWRHDHEASQSAVTSASTANGVAGVGTALTAVSSAAESTATPTSAAQTQAPVSEADTASAAEPSVVEAAPSQEAEPSTAEAAAASPSPAASSVETSLAAAASDSQSTRSSITHTTVVTASRSSTVVRVTASASASAAAAKNDDEPEKIAGLNKTTFIIIIVVAGLLALVAVGWTVFRKWKLRPSSRFDEKMRPIDFSPDNDNGSDPLYMEEKAHHHHMRNGSNSSAAMHRQELVAELDSKHVEGVPDHDFTAGGGNMAGHGAGGFDHYDADPYAHAEAYEYDAAYHYDQRGYEHEQPTQDTGYADLHRGNSIGSGSGHGHGHGQQYPIESFPVADHYLSRPAADPYASSHRY